MEISVLNGLEELRINRITNKHKKDSLSILCFSFDRAFQLDALLGSFYEKVKNANTYELVILYRCSTSQHRQAYIGLIKMYKQPNIKFIEQDDRIGFKKDAISILENFTSSKIMFLVDDILFIEDVDLSEVVALDSSIYIPSLRLGLNTTFCYAHNSDQNLPAFIKGINTKLNVWKWHDGEHDWNYVLSVDGNIFLREDYLLLMKSCVFRAPNTLEAITMARYKEYFRTRLGVCYAKSKILNLPINHVMLDGMDLPELGDNRFGDMNQDDLLKIWESGKRMNFRKLYGYNNKGVHEEIKFEIMDR